MSPLSRGPGAPSAVTLRFRPRGEALPRRVRLFGEMGDWINPIPMTRGPGPDGAFEAALVLPVGVYAYKFVVDGAWLADPENPRTRSTGGNQNSVLSVGGAGEPFLHAPASPYVAELDGGGLRITAALRRGTPGSPHVRWTEGDGEPTRETAMAAAVEEDEHVVYQVTLPLSARRLAYRLVVHAPGSPSVVEPPMDEAPFAYHRPVGRRRVPPWWRDAVLYTVYVDRFRPARDRAGWERDPGRGRAAGGHLEGVRRSLRELRELGITVLYLTPIHVASSSHRYDFVDPLAVDPALGGEAAFRALVEDAHTLELRIVLDLSFSHAGLAFPPCQDVMARGRDSAYASWFRWSDDGPERSRLLHYGRRLDAPLLDLEHPDVQALVLQAVDNWASFGIDGLRLDMAAEVPLPLARRIRARLLARRPDAVVFGELVPAHAWRWATNDALDAATDFGFHGVVTDFVARRAISAGEAVARLRATDLVRGGASATHVRFVSSHDHARLATVAAHAGAPERAALGLVLLFTMPGVPALLYGEEIGLRAPRLEELREDAWADRMPMRWEGGGGERGEGRDLALRNVVQRLIGARRGSTALREGTLEILHAGDEVLVFRRTSGDVVDTYVNVGDTALELEIGDDEQPVLDPIVTVGGPSVDGETVRLPPRSALVARRLDSPARRPQHNLLVRDRDFERARPVTRATPTRMDFALTERCNLRCAHCITHAPERTAGGTARTMTPHVLDRLRPWLGEASYFGFVHGGESLTAPIFFDVLEAIRAARAGAPYVAHLLSNGVLLTGATLLRLAALGVNSISVSLDGATAETNDAIREGGRFAAIVQRVREAVAVRRSASLDLRLGLSFVALAQNVHEVGGMVELAADVGVDWLKIEEGVPANAFAERSLVGLGREELGAALEAARKRAKALGLVLVDHTVERVIWRCTLNENPDAAAFVAADEYANRSEIHPCRAPWEVACIEPNGDVRLGHFFGPILGNVSTGSLDDVWNSPVARDARAASHAARLCGLSGPVACLRR